MKAEKGKPASKKPANAASPAPTPEPTPTPTPEPTPTPDKPAPAAPVYPNIPTNDWIDDVTKNDPHYEGSIVLHGYLGKSSDDSSVDLYADAGLNKKVTIHKDDIIHVQKTGGTDGTVEGSHVWVKRDGHYSYDTAGNHTNARFLQGDIYTTYLQNTGAGSPIPTTTAAVACPTICGNLTDDKGMPVQNIFTFICANATPAQGNNAAQANNSNNTLATVCTQIGCLPTQPIGCHTAVQGCQPQTNMPGCTGVTATPGANAANPGNTVATTCTQLLGCTTATAHGTAATVCTQHTCPPHISLPGCVHTGAATVCKPHLSLPGCVHTGPETICITQTEMPGCTGVTATPDAAAGTPGLHTYPSICVCATLHTQITCPEANVGAAGTAATVCTQPAACPPHISLPGCVQHTHLMGCTTVTATPTQPAANILPTDLPTHCPTVHQHHCPTHHHHCYTKPNHCVSLPGNCPTVGIICPPHVSLPGCVQHTHLMGCTTVTATPQANANVMMPTTTVQHTHIVPCTTLTVATQCTHHACPPHISLPGCVQHTYLLGCNTATVQPTHLLGCNTATTPPTHLLGCNTATIQPTHLMGCTTVTATPEANANAMMPTTTVQHTHVACPPHISIPGCVHTMPCPVTIHPCGGVHTEVCPVTVPPHCGGIHTNVCPVTIHPCGGIQTEVCRVTVYPCGGVQTQVCGTTMPMQNANAAAPQNIGNTGWYTCGQPHISLPGCVQHTQLLGCNTATVQPTHLLGCNTATSTPTHLLGCNTATIQPTHLMGCTTVTSTPEANVAGPVNTLAPSWAWIMCNATKIPMCPPHVSLPGCVHTIPCPVTIHPCGGVQTEVCPVTVPPHCGGIHTNICPVTIYPCGGVQTQVCGITLPVQNANAATPQTIGVTGWLGCGVTNTIAGYTHVCPPHISLPGCVQQTNMPGCTGVTATPATDSVWGDIGNFFKGKYDGPIDQGFTVVGHGIAQGATAVGNFVAQNATVLTAVAAQGQQNVGPTGWYTCAPSQLGCTTVTSTPTQPLTSAPGFATMNYYCVPSQIPACPPHISLPGCVQPTQLYGCNTATTQPTQLLGCNTATSTPTQLLGCNTATATPTYLMGCTGVTTPPAANTPAANAAFSDTLLKCERVAAPAVTIYAHCPTLGFTCTYIACPTIETCAQQQANAAAPQNVGVTGWYTCTPNTLVGPTGTNPCPPHTQPIATMCCLGITRTCPEQAAQNPLGPTGWYTCTMVGPTGTQGCDITNTIAGYTHICPPHISLPGCVQPTQLYGCNTATTQPTHLLGCTTATHTPTNMPGCGGATATPNANAAGINLTFPICTISPIVCVVTAVAHCNQNAAPAANAAAPQTIGVTGWQGCQAPDNTLAPSAICATNIACNVTLPPACAQGQAANANFDFPTTRCSIPIVCAITAIAGCGGSPILTVQCTIPVVCAVTAIAGCGGGGATIPVICQGVNATNEQKVGPTGWLGCGQTNMPGCGGATGTPPHISLPGCVQTTQINMCFTQPVVCGVLPPSVGCPPAPQAANAPAPAANAATLPVTQCLQVTQSAAQCAPATLNCVPTVAIACIPTGGCHITGIPWVC